MGNENLKIKSTTSHWGAFDVHVSDGKIVDVAPFSKDPNPSKIPSNIPQAIYHKTRVRNPHIRKGWLEGGVDRGRKNRGNDRYIEVPWDEALDIAADEIKRVIKESGNSSIYGGSYGWASAGKFHHAPSQVHRFLNSIGGYVGSYGTYSAGAAEAIIPHILGKPFFKLTFDLQNSWQQIEEATQTLVMFGGINEKNSQVNIGGVTKHQTKLWLEKFSKKGIALINVSPQRSDTTHAARWMPVIPGSDTALMLGIAYHLEKNNLIDEDFLKRCTVGYEQFRSYLLGVSDEQPKTPEWAAQFCGVAPGEIEDLANTMASTRCLITVAWSLQRGEHGEQPFWMATALAAMLGQIGLTGGGIGYGYGAIAGVGVPDIKIKSLSLPQGENKVENFIPVARIADMLLNPGASYQYNGSNKTYPNIDLIYWCGGNPFHHHQDLNRLREAWKKPSTVILNDPWWTASARHADIVFPATTPYEREDVAHAQGDSFLFYMPKLIKEVGGSRNDFDIFNDLATRLGCGAKFSENKNSQEWLDSLYSDFKKKNHAIGLDLPALEELKEQNWFELPQLSIKNHAIPFESFRNRPEDFPLGTPSGKIEIFSSTIDNFDYDDCIGHPAWFEPSEWLGSDDASKYPLHLMSPQPGDKLHSQLECALADARGKRPTEILINTEDASDRAIEDGALVKVFNQRGITLARAKITTSIRGGVVSLPTGAWFGTDRAGIEQQGNPNAVTRDKGTSRLGQGSTAHSTLVEVEVVESSVEVLQREL